MAQRPELSGVPHTRGGQSTSVAPSLRARLESLSPGALVGFNAYMSTRGEPDDRKSYSGNDASAELICHLSEAMLCFEQIRMEVADQMAQHHHRGEQLPRRTYLLMTRLLSLEPILVQGLDSASCMHSELWELEGTPWGKRKRRSRKKKEDGTQNGT